MNNLTNYHSHCDFCDGHAPMELFVREAVKEGFSSYGISSHAPFPIQKVLYFNNLFYINDLYMYMCLLRDKLGTKIGVKNAKKNKYRH